MNPIQLWAIYFASIVAIKEHPRNEKGADLAACAELADRMMGLTLLRYRHGFKELKCQSDQQHS